MAFVLVLVPLVVFLPILLLGVLILPVLFGVSCSLLVAAFSFLVPAVLLCGLFLDLLLLDFLCFNILLGGLSHAISLPDLLLVPPGPGSLLLCLLLGCPAGDPCCAILGFVVGRSGCACLVW